MKLNETYKITNANNLWIRSCTQNGIDINRITSFDPLYLTQDIDYAYYYCMSKHKQHEDYILVIEIPDGTELCHLYDPNDYADAAKNSGFPEQMSNMFKQIEPYFSFNTSPSIRLKDGRTPNEYIVAANFVSDQNQKNGIIEKTIEKLMLNKMYKKCGSIAIKEKLNPNVIGYVQAFDFVNAYMKTIPTYVKHKYVDILQFAFFDMLNKKLEYKGYYCPEVTRQSQSIMNKDHKKDAYYFGDSAHTHPCIAIFDKSIVTIKAIIPKVAFYCSFATIVNNDSSLIKYHKRVEALQKTINYYEVHKPASQSELDRLMDNPKWMWHSNNIKHAKYQIMQALGANSIDYEFRREKRNRDQLS